MQQECHLVQEIQPDIIQTVSPIEIFSLLTDLEELLELICSSEWKKIHSYQVTHNKLPTIAEYWRVDR